MPRWTSSVMSRGSVYSNLESDKCAPRFTLHIAINGHDNVWAGTFNTGDRTGHALIRITSGEPLWMEYIYIET